MKHVLTEYLPGPEYTVDCFTDRRGTLRFVGPRSRDRISNGISVHTSLVQDETQEFRHFADAINHAIAFRGAWFFQVKKDLDGQLTLLEIASRLGGSSAIHRALGVNFALLSVFDAFDVDVDILANNYEVELDRALDTRFQTHFPYSVVYIDLDDTIVVNGKVNLEAVAFLYKCRNEGKKVVLITKHAEPLDSALDGFCIRQLFDQVIHLKKEDKKSTFITGPGAIFIDDSFSERMEVSRHCGIPVFDVHMIEALL